MHKGLFFRLLLGLRLFVCFSKTGKVNIRLIFPLLLSCTMSEYHRFCFSCKLLSTWWWQPSSLCQFICDHFHNVDYMLPETGNTVRVVFVSRVCPNRNKETGEKDLFGPFSPHSFPRIRKWMSPEEREETVNRAESSLRPSNPQPMRAQQSY